MDDFSDSFVVAADLNDSCHDVLVGHFKQYSGFNAKFEKIFRRELAGVKNAVLSINNVGDGCGHTYCKRTKMILISAHSLWEPKQCTTKEVFLHLSCEECKNEKSAKVLRLFIKPCLVRMTEESKFYCLCGKRLFIEK
uniref:Uncharacterized protein n=1 Tax=Agrotis segetum granulosis virus TaxID=10464 RepID=A0A023MHE9_GVAS|nr:hypothetical protein AsGV067 [Agrotis segetum granulovirus]